MTWAAWLIGAFLLMVIVLGILFSGMRMPGQSYTGELPSLTEPETHARNRLETHVAVLCNEIGPRNYRHCRALNQAADYIESVFEESGYAPVCQEFTVYQKNYANIIAELAGTSRQDEIIVIGAHYDTVSNVPGADDNASAVAMLLELAGLLKGADPARTIRFVAFANEEPPFFGTSDMGSAVYARACKARKDNIAAMICLESVGYYSDRPGSQRLPFPLGLFYPSRGDFIAFVGNLRSAGLTRRCVESFRRQTKFPCEGGAVPAFIPGVAWSDQRSFWKQGYPAVMVTDTALYRNPNYHTISDESGTLKYESMARVTHGVFKVVEELGGRGVETN